MEVTNKLVHLAEFEKILVDYRPSDESLKILKSTPLVVLVGPTASGRNTLISILLKTGRYHYIVSNTTRHPRRNNGIMEQNGVEYWFTPEETFLDDLKRGAYLEAAVIHRQQVSGISIAEIKKAHDTKRIAIDEIEVAGARNIHGYKPDTLSIFLLPPTFDIWMERLKGRGEMEESEVRRRLESAAEEIVAALEADFYHFVVNNEIGEAAMAVDALANGRLPDVAKQAQGRAHAEQLAIDVRLYLKSA